ncbi:hypothetical protein VTL71DRAFT_864 [Oculimacula yallundae]|uniref:Uncharacterized protein n=1 Tax=Oculimacula yallundae TaxID=86028 RepID=A0ABR4D2C2_9HELO
MARRNVGGPRNFKLTTPADAFKSSANASGRKSPVGNPVKRGPEFQTSNTNAKTKDPGEPSKASNPTPQTPSTTTFELPWKGADDNEVSLWFKKMLNPVTQAQNFRKGHKIMLKISGLRLREMKAEELEETLSWVFNKETAKRISGDIVSARNEEMKTGLGDGGSEEHRQQEPSESSIKSKASRRQSRQSD